MTHNWKRHVAYIIRSDKITAPNCSERLGTKQESNRRSRTRSVVNKWMNTRSPHDVDSIMLHANFHTCAAHFLTAVNNCVWFLQGLNVNLIQTLGIEPRVPSG